MPLGFMDNFIKELCETFNDFTILIDCNGYSQNNFHEFVKRKEEMIAKFRVEKQVSEANQEKHGKITDEQTEALLDEMYAECSPKERQKQINECIIC